MSERGKRLSPDQLAKDLAARLGGKSGAHRRRGPRFDIVTASRVILILGIVVIGFGVVFAGMWLVSLIGFKTPGTVTQGTPVLACPGDPQIGALFNGQRVQIIGRSEDGLWYALRDDRGPGNVVFADSSRITPDEDPGALSVRTCTPGLAIAGTSSTTTSEETTVTTAGEPSTTLTTTTLEGEAVSPRPGRASHSPVPTTTTTTTTTTIPGSTSTSTSTPGSSTTSQPTTTTFTSTSTSTSTTVGTTTTSTPTTTSTTAATTTTTSTVPPTTSTTTSSTTTTTSTTDPTTTTTTTVPTTTTTVPD